MADMHSHILPGVDDGAQTQEDAINLLRMAVKDGVMIQILTPHIDSQRYKKNTKALLESRFREFCDSVIEARIPIELHLAAEVRICQQIMPMVDADTIPWLGSWHGQKTFLLEFPLNSVPVGTDNLVRWLRNQSILPVIAHPERNRVFQKYPEKLQPLLDMECPLQINAGSITGQFGYSSKKFAQRLLKDDNVSVIASDCHNLSHRPPNLKQGTKAAAKLVGKEKAIEMVTSNVFDLMIGDQHRAAI
jgi:protein-tyrosine phosphatase